VLVCYFCLYPVWQLEYFVEIVMLEKLIFKSTGTFMDLYTR
jgi:hypothetical protein